MRCAGACKKCDRLQSPPQSPALADRGPQSPLQLLVLVDRDLRANLANVVRSETSVAAWDWREGLKTLETMVCH